MKCEIIDGVLVVEPGTATERWAVEHWHERNDYQSVRTVVQVAPAPHLYQAAPPPPPFVPPMPPAVRTSAEMDDELDAIFGPLPTNPPAAG